MGMTACLENLFKVRPWVRKVRTRTPVGLAHPSRRAAIGQQDPPAVCALRPITISLFCLLQPGLKQTPDAAKKAQSADAKAGGAGHGFLGGRACILARLDVTIRAHESFV